MNWYIGQPIVAIKSHQQGVYKYGDEFTIKGLMISQCSCKRVLINIGFFHKTAKCQCNLCLEIYPAPKEWFFGEESFAPLDIDINEIENVLQESNS